MARSGPVPGSTLARRRDAATVCLAAAIAAMVVVPGLHVLVHVAESAPRTWHVAGHRTVAPAAHRHGDGAVHSHAAQNDGDGDRHERVASRTTHGHPHSHAGDGRGPRGHGQGSLEHFGVAHLASDAPVLPPPGLRVETSEPPALASRVDSAPLRRAHGIRGPPASRAS